MTLAQLYSTASYQAHDLTGIGLGGNNLSGGNFAGQNLTNANFTMPRSPAPTSPAPRCKGRTSGSTGLTLAQLYSTASYQAHDLTGIGLYGNNLSGGNFAGQNLTNASSMLPRSPVPTSARPTSRTRASPTPRSRGELHGADTRGAYHPSFPSSAITTNLIRPDGHIAGLDLGGGQQLVVRDYDGNPSGCHPAGYCPSSIYVDGHFLMGPGGVLQLVFDADAWDSLISFAPGIAVSLGGTLELLFAPDVSVASQVGRTIDLFDWTGVAPTGAFAVDSPYSWDLSKLYTTGEVTLATVPGLPGDFNNNGIVDAADYVVWRNNHGTPAAYNTWRANFGQPSGSGSVAGANAAVPEPSTLLMLILAAVGLCSRRRRSA